MKEKTCCFTGHRIIKHQDREKLQNDLNITIGKLIDKGVTTFVCGGALGFDTVASQNIIMFKKYNSLVRLVLAIPCITQGDRWNNADKETYKYIKSCSDEIYVISQEYTNECMMQRNRFMVDMSGFCVAYFRGISGGTLNTIRYAKENNLEIIYL